MSSSLRSSIVPTLIAWIFCGFAVKSSTTTQQHIEAMPFSQYASFCNLIYKERSPQQIAEQKASRTIKVGQLLVVQQLNEKQIPCQN